MRALENALHGDLDRIVQATKAFLSLKSVLPYSMAFTSYSSELSARRREQRRSPVDLDTVLRALSGSASRSQADEGASVASYAYDTIASRRWFASMNCDVDAGLDQSSTLLSELEIDNNVFSNELRCLQSWKSFAQMLHLLMKKWRSGAPDARLFKLSECALLQSLTIETLRVFHENVGLVERCQQGALFSILSREGLVMARATSGLLLTYISAVDVSRSTSPDEWVESMGLLAEIGKKLSHFPLVRSTVRGYFWNRTSVTGCSSSSRTPVLMTV